MEPAWISARGLRVAIVFVALRCAAAGRCQPFAAFGAPCLAIGGALVSASIWAAERIFAAIRHLLA